MWVPELNGCGCWKPSHYEEYKIPRVIKPIVPELKLPLSEVEPCLGNLKDKVIDEYLKVLDSLECGILPDLEFILDEISLIDTWDDLDDTRNYIIQYYLTNNEYK